MTNIDGLYNKEISKNLFGKDHFADKKLNFKIIEHGTILPHKHMYINGQWTWGFGGIVDRRGQFVTESFVHEGDGAAYTPLEQIQRVPTAAVYMGLYYPVWGHAITDNIRRLWFLKTDVFKKYFQNCPIIYIPWAGVFTLENQQNFRRLLEILEIDPRRLLPVVHPVQFDNVIIPDGGFFPEGEVKKFTNEYREAIELVRNFALKNRRPLSSKKFYYFYGRAQVGEERLAEYFKSKGYEIVSPENLSLDEQLNILINAESFASTLGSCSHNSIFLRDGTEVIFIPRAANRFTDYQQALDQIHELKISYLDSSLSLFDTFNGPYCFILSEQLKKYFGDKFKRYAEDDFRAFLTYARFSVSRGFKQNMEVMPYYAPLLQKFYPQLNQNKKLLTEFGANFI